MIVMAKISKDSCSGRNTPFHRELAIFGHKILRSLQYIKYIETETEAHREYETALTNMMFELEMST
jgi:hypothetical protein